MFLWTSPLKCLNAFGGKYQRSDLFKNAWWSCRSKMSSALVSFQYSESSSAAPPPPPPPIPAASLLPWYVESISKESFFSNFSQAFNIEQHPVALRASQILSDHCSLAVFLADFDLKTHCTTSEKVLCAPKSPFWVKLVGCGGLKTLPSSTRVGGVAQSTKDLLLRVLRPFSDHKPRKNTSRCSSSVCALLKTQQSAPERKRNASEADKRQTNKEQTIQ